MLTHYRNTGLRTYRLNKMRLKAFMGGLSSYNAKSARNTEEDKPSTGSKMTLRQSKCN